MATDSDDMSPGDLSEALEQMAIDRKAYRRRAPLTSHVPVRFSDATVLSVRELAAEDGVTVSGWIRTVVEAEVRRRQPATPSLGTLGAHLGAEVRDDDSAPTTEQRAQSLELVS